MASGSFRSSTYSGAGTGFRRYIEVKWTSSNNTSNNTSAISWTAYSRSPDSSTTNWVYAKQVKVTINGSTFTVIGSTATKLYKNRVIGSGSITIPHNSDGTKSVNVSITAQIYVYGSTNSSYSGSITMTPNPVYTLTISAGSGSSITVNRTSCAGIGSTGNLTAGTKKLCKNDKLKITFTPKTNYSITTHKVNNINFNSGGTHTVSSNVSVSATATPLKSTVGATDANIGSVSTITVTRYNSSYTHTITYKFGSATGTIATKTKNTSIAWTIPDSFYNEIPNSKTGTCELTIQTFKGNSSLGTNTARFTVTAALDKSRPDIFCSIKDINPTTIALTGDENVLIRYKSTAECVLDAVAKNAASISKLTINTDTVTGVTSTTKQYIDVSNTSFAFSAADSRGYSRSQTITPTVISYIPLTCNPILSRETPTGGVVLMDVSGNVFRGSFGLSTNSMKILYRYKETGGETESAYGDWNTISPTEIIYGTSTYRSDNSIVLGEDFDYQKEYMFEIKVVDGSETVELSSVVKTVIVRKGIPVFDWGENDFNVNVDFSCQGNMTCNGGISLPNVQSILWGDVNNDTGWYMKSSQTITLPKKISECLNGIVLAFSIYIDDTPQNYSWHLFFIPKYYVKYGLNKTGGISFFMVPNTLSYVAQKYLYITDTTISGNDVNIESDEKAVIPYKNNSFVLRFILEV